MIELYTKVYILVLNFTAKLVEADFAHLSSFRRNTTVQKMRKNWQKSPRPIRSRFSKGSIMQIWDLKTNRDRARFVSLLSNANFKTQSLNEILIQFTTSKLIYA